MKAMKIFTKLVWASALTLGLQVMAHAESKSPWCSSGKTVKFAGLDWESGQFITELMRLVLEKGYDCKTDAIPGQSVAMEAALARNDIQIFGEEWIGRSDAWNNAFKEGTVFAVGNVIDGASEGWFVPEYVVKGDAARKIKAVAPNLKTVADLPQYKEVFKDPEEPSKGRFLNCPTGWTCEGVNSQLLKALKLQDSYVNFRPGTGAALDAEISSNYQRGKPVLFYYWSPTALMGKYKFSEVKQPAYDEACYKTISDKDHDNPCPSGPPLTKIQAGLSKPFYLGDAVLVDFLKKFSLKIDVLNQVLAEQSASKKSFKDVAVDFLRKREDIWKNWVPADVSQKIRQNMK